MITVEVRLYASLQKYRPGLEIGEALAITLDDKAELGNLLNKLKVPKEEVAIVMINGRGEKESYILRGGDRIGLFPPIAGDKND